MTTNESNNQNEILEWQFKPDQNGICTCSLCEPSSWARILNILNDAIAQEEAYRAAYPEIARGGFSPTYVRKQKI